MIITYSKTGAGINCQHEFVVVFAVVAEFVISSLWTPLSFVSPKPFRNLLAHK